MTRFVSFTQKPHIRITLLDRQLIKPSPPLFLTFEDVAKEAAPLLRSSADASHTILVTNKMLANTDRANLFYSVRGNFGVVSLRHVADPRKSEEQGLALRYLATMVPMAAMHALANDRQISLLPDRSPVTEHGCLHDFSNNRLLLIEKLRRGPELCGAEVAAMTEAFGPTLVSEYQQILQRASQ